MILCTPTPAGIWYRREGGPRDFVYVFDEQFGTYQDFRNPARKRLAKFLGVSVTQIRTVTLAEFVANGRAKK